MYTIEGRNLPGNSLLACLFVIEVYKLKEVWIISFALCYFIFSLPFQLEFMILIFFFFQKPLTLTIKKAVASPADVLEKYSNKMKHNNTVVPAGITSFMYYTPCIGID